MKWSLTNLAGGLALSAVLAGPAPGATCEEAGVECPPEMGTSDLEFKACTAEGHEAAVHIRVKNFVLGETVLPGYHWATKEENAAAALKASSEVLTPFIAGDPDDKVEAGSYFQDDLLFRRTTIHGDYGDGRGEGDWPITVWKKIWTVTKMTLMEQGKDSPMGISPEPRYTYVKVDRKASCTSARVEAKPARKA